MSLLPKIPCRKLFLDSRHALPGGSSTEFEVEVPQGGLDLPDNCVGFIDSISIPSFPNVFEGRHRLFYREDAAREVAFRELSFAEDNYTPTSFAQQLVGMLPSVPSSLTNSISATAGNDVFTVSLSGAATGESVRVLTDQELAQLTHPRDGWDLTGEYDIPARDLASGGLWSANINIAGTPTAVSWPVTRTDLMYSFSYSWGDVPVLRSGDQP